MSSRLGDRTGTERSRSHALVEECTFLCLCGDLDQLVAGVIDQTAASRDIGESSHIVEHRHVTHVTATNTYYS